MKEGRSMFYVVAHTFLSAFESLLWNLIHHKVRIYVLCIYLLHVDVHYTYKKNEYIFVIVWIC